jgi:hypothetical protein
MNEMQNLADGLREEIERVFWLINLNSPGEMEDDWLNAKKSIDVCDVVRMHEYYEKLKTWE